MPEGIVRDGKSYRNGNPVPATDPKFDSNPVTWTPSPAHFSNPVPATDATFDSNPVTWATPNPAHFGNSVGPSVQATPTFSPVAGTYASAQDVTVTSAGADAIYYTTDGSTPTTGSTLYSGPVHVAVTETLKALATKAGLTNSAIGTAAYTITSVPAPVVVQVISASVNNVTPFVLTLPNPTTVGNAIVVYVSEFSQGTATGVTDDGGNQYSLVRGPDVSAADGAASGVYRYIFMCMSSTGAAQNISIAYSPRGVGQACVVEVSGANAVSPVDTTVYHSVAAATWTTSITTDEANALLLCFAGYYDGAGANAFTHGAAWSQVDQLAEQAFAGQREFCQQQTVATASTVTVDMTCATVAGGIEVVALKG